MKLHRLTAAVAAAALFAAACTDEPAPEPTPTSSPSPTVVDDRDTADRDLDVALLYPDPDEIRLPLDAYEQAAGRARASFGSQLTSFREVNLDAPNFRPDVLTLLADEGTSLTCAIGPSARDVVNVARAVPSQRFCAIDDRTGEVPANAIVTWFRYEEAAYLLGFAAARMLPPEEPGTLGFLTPSFDTRSERERLAFTAGARAARPDVAIAIETLTADSDASLEERAAAAAATLFDEQEAGVIMVSAGVPIEPVLLAAQQRLRLVTGIGPPISRGAPEGLEPFVLATAHARLELGLAIPIQRYLEGWQGGEVSLGFVDEALVLSPGGSVRWNEVRDEIAALRERIERGEVPLG